uniref:Uncharacterized protein n=1 Tax=Arundo donax TaxID=35708 RepID=A0A0A9BDN6_ARUDO
MLLSEARKSNLLNATIKNILIAKSLARANLLMRSSRCLHLTSLFSST